MTLRELVARVKARRPVQLMTFAPHAESIHAADRTDPTPSMIGADYLDEQGYQHVAHAMRATAAAMTHTTYRPGQKAIDMPPGYRVPNPFGWTRPDGIATGHLMDDDGKRSTHVQMTVHNDKNKGRNFVVRVGHQTHDPVSGRAEVGFMPHVAVVSEDEGMFHGLLDELRLDRRTHNKMLRAWHSGRRPDADDGSDELQQLSMVQRLRRTLQLAKKLPKADPSTYMTAPEKKLMDEGSSDFHGKYKSLTHEVDRLRHPFGGTLPGTHTIQTLAQFGSPAKGEYENSFHMAHAMFGHDEDGVAAWMAVNAALSPRTEYLDHASAATMITAHWLASGKPKDPESIRRIMHEVNFFGKLYTPELAARPFWEFNPKTYKYSGIQPGKGQTFGGTTAMDTHHDRVARVLGNIEEMREAFQNPGGDPGHALALLAGGGLKKVPNFAISYMNGMFGSAIDMHMGRLMFHPDLNNIHNHSDFLAQVKAQLGERDKSHLSRIEQKALQDYPISSELVKALMKKPDLRVKTMGVDKDGNPKMKSMTVAKYLQTLNAKLLNNDAHYMAYKTAVADAAKRMGWTTSQVQESVWTGIVALTAARSLGIPPDKIQEYLTHDTVRKGWQNHEAFIFPGVVDAYRRAGTSPAAIQQLEERAREHVAKHSRPGIIPISDPAHLRRTYAYLPNALATGKDAAGPIRKGLIKSLRRDYRYDESTGQFKASRQGLPIRLASYDAPVDFVSALQRAVASNHTTFVEHLKKVLEQSGIQPHDVSPAVHDTTAGSRVSVVAAGAYRGGRPHTGAAWTGLLGRQPGMMSFQSHPAGPDSVYRFQHSDADVVRQALEQAGVTSRVLAPRDKMFHVFVYDQGRQKREGIAQALQGLGVTAEEWRGQGTPVGGNKDDMGRAQYRTQINQAESAQMMRGYIVQPTRLAAPNPPLPFKENQWQGNAKGGPESRVRTSPTGQQVPIPKPYTPPAPAPAPSAAATTLDSHVAAIRTDPTNPQHHHALADHLEQQGNPLHKVVRWATQDAVSKNQNPITHKDEFHPVNEPDRYAAPVHLTSGNGSTVTFRDRVIPPGMMFSFSGPMTHVTYTPRGVKNSHGYGILISKDKADLLHQQLTTPQTKVT